jgi:hypothetical protein
MILIEGIPVILARLAAEQKAKEWLAKTRPSTSDAAIKKASVDAPSQTSSSPRRAA